MEINKIYQSDCIDFMKSLPDNSIDAAITDPPYGTTAVACKELNRNFIDCEINPDYIQIANKRVKYTIKNII